MIKRKETVLFIRLDAETRERMELVAAQQESSLSAIARQAIKAFLERQESNDGTQRLESHDAGRAGSE